MEEEKSGKKASRLGRLSSCLLDAGLRRLCRRRRRLDRPQPQAALVLLTFDGPEGGFLPPPPPPPPRSVSSHTI